MPKKNDFTYDVPHKMTILYNVISLDPNMDDQPFHFLEGKP